MDIGDKIRLLHGQEEGIIRRFIDNKTVEVEIEDGFLIPVLKNEVVTIAREESERFNKEIRSVSSEIDLENSNLLEEQSEIFLAIETRNIEINLWLINQTINTLLFTVHTVSAEQFHGLSYGILRKYTYSKIDTWNLKDQGQWPILMIDIISYQEKSKNPGIKISKRLTINKNHVLKTKLENDTTGLHHFMMVSNSLLKGGGLPRGELGSKKKCKGIMLSKLGLEPART